MSDEKNKWNPFAFVCLAITWLKFAMFLRDVRGGFTSWLFPFHFLDNWVFHIALIPHTSQIVILAIAFIAASTPFKPLSSFSWIYQLVHAGTLTIAACAKSKGEVGKTIFLWKIFCPSEKRNRLEIPWSPWAFSSGAWRRTGSFRWSKIYSVRKRKNPKLLKRHFAIYLQKCHAITSIIQLNQWTLLYWDRHKSTPHIFLSTRFMPTPRSHGMLAFRESIRLKRGRGPCIFLSKAQKW